MTTYRITCYESDDCFEPILTEESDPIDVQAPSEDIARLIACFSMGRLDFLQDAEFIRYSGIQQTVAKFTKVHSHPGSN